MMDKYFKDWSEVAFEVYSFIVIDRNVLKLFPEIKHFFKSSYLVVDSSEDLKSLEYFNSFVQRLSEKSFNPSREDKILAIGGGVVGDLVGFLASIWKRGIAWDVLPTTWISILDSSYGGKTALNVGSVKNLMGTFHPPHQRMFVFDLVDLILDDDQQINIAYGEIVKTILMSSSLADFSSSPSQILLNNWRTLSDVKKEYVDGDLHERENKRILLNFGHTIAHSFERSFNMSHGQSVYYGILFSLWLSFEKGYLSSVKYSQLIAWMKKTDWDQYLCYSINQEKLCEIQAALEFDKKLMASNLINFIFFNGSKAIVKELQLSDLKLKFRRYCQDVLGVADA